MHQQKQKRKNKIGQGLIKVKIVILLIAIIVLVVFQQFLLVKDKRTRYRMGHDELTGIYNWEHLVQKAENQTYFKRITGCCAVYGNHICSILRYHDRVQFECSSGSNCRNC